MGSHATRNKCLATYSAHFRGYSLLGPTETIPRAPTRRREIDSVRVPRAQEHQGLLDTRLSDEELLGRAVQSNGAKRSAIWARACA